MGNLRIWDLTSHFQAFQVGKKGEEQIYLTTYVQTLRTIFTLLSSSGTWALYQWKAGECSNNWEEQKAIILLSFNKVSSHTCYKQINNYKQRSTFRDVALPVIWCTHRGKSLTPIQILTLLNCPPWLIILVCVEWYCCITLENASHSITLY